MDAIGTAFGLVCAVPALLWFAILNGWTQHTLDDINEVLFVQGSRRLARQVMEVDLRVVDGVVNLTGFLALVSGEALKYIENGRAQFYALIVFVAVLGFVVVSGMS